MMTLASASLMLAVAAFPADPREVPLGPDDPARYWRTEELFRTPAFRPAPFSDSETEGMRALLVTGKGPADSTAEFFCYYAVPDGERPAAGWPGVVLVHGGGGTAFPKYVRLWRELGFAVLAPNWYNCRPAPGSTNAPPSKGEPPSIPLPGGRRQDHVANVANMVLAHSLLRSFPEVDAGRTVFVRLSWGSWYGGCVAAVDSRFRGCVEIYCGDLWPDVRKGRELVNGRFLHAAKVPVWWVVSTNDRNALPDSLNAGFSACGRWDGVAAVNQLPHSHVGFEFPSVHRMARYYTGSGKRLPRLGMPRLEGGKVVARVLDAGGGIDRVRLGFTTESSLPVDKRRWQYADGTLVGDVVCADLPEGTVQCYLAAFEKGESQFGDLCGTTPFFTVPSVQPAGVTFRFDDVHPAAQWKELTRLFDARGLKATFAINAGWLAAEDQRAFLREADGRGHEIMDHTHDHAIFSYRYHEAVDRDRLRDDPAVAACCPEESRLNLRYEIDLAHPLNFRFRGFVTNGVLVVAPDVARRLHRPDKVYVPSLDRAFGIFDSPDGHFELRTFWTTTPAKLPDVAETELVCVSRHAFRFSDDVLRFQARRTREVFLRLGLPAPRAWAQPGGWEPYLTDVDFRRVYADEFGYVLGDAFVPHGEKPDPRLAAFHNRYRSYFDNASVTQESIRRDIRAALGKGETLSFISHMKPPKGMTWEAWLAETAALLDWLVAEKIPVLTASEVGVRLSATAATGLSAGSRASLQEALNPPAEYADFPRKVTPVAKYACADFDVEVYSQRNGPDTCQRVMMAVPRGLKGRAPCVIAPFYFPEAMLGFNPADGSPDSPLVKSGTNLTYYSEIAYMSDLARRGYVTISADAYHLTYRNHEEPWWSCSSPTLDFLWSNPWKRVGEALNEDWPQWSGVGKLVFDTRLLVDLAAADPRVDATRIGMIGHSLGGKMAFCAGMADPRVKVVVASDFGLGWTQTNWGDCWYWGGKLAGMRAQGLSNVDLLSQSGGKPFCLIAGKYDDADSGRLMRSAKGYERHPERLLLVHHGTGHRPPREATERGYAFLTRFL